jgi:hypothetical protein
MGQKQAKPAAEVKPVYKKTEFPNDLLQELQPFIGSKKKYIL